MQLSEIEEEELPDLFSDDEEPQDHVADEAMLDASEDEVDPPLSNAALLAQFVSLSADVSKNSGQNKGWRMIDHNCDSLDADHAQTLDIAKSMNAIKLGDDDGQKRALALEERSTVSADGWGIASAFMRHVAVLMRKFVAWAQSSMEKDRTMLALINCVKDLCANNATVGADNSTDITQLQAQGAALKEKVDKTAAREKLGRLHVNAMQPILEERIRNLEIWKHEQQSGAAQGPRPTPTTHVGTTQHPQQVPVPAVHWGPPAAEAMQPPAPKHAGDMGAAFAKAVSVLGAEAAGKYTVQDLQAMGAAMMTPEVSKGGGFRVPQPAKYSGEDTKVDVDDIMFTFATYLTDIDVPKPKWASVAMHLLTGAAQQQYVTYAQSILPATPTWEQFLQVMHQFAKPNKRFTALQALMSMKQQRTVHGYVQEFRQLLAKIGDPAPSATEQIIHFWRGLSEAAKQTSRVDPQGVFWTDPEALLAHVCNVELSANMTSAHKQAYQAFHTPHTPALHLKAVRANRLPKMQEVRKTPKLSSGAGPSAPRSEEFTPVARGDRGQGSQGGRGQGSYGGRGYGGASGGRGGRGGRDGGQGPIPCRWCLMEKTGKEFTHRDGAHSTYMAAYRDATAERRA
jgi:uncharacterized membrane protein YgcG